MIFIDQNNILGPLTREGREVTQTFFIRGCAILALNIAPINPAALPKKILINPENKSLVRH